MEDMTEEQLMAILGEDPTILAELLRKKQDAEERSHEGYQMKRGNRGEVVFDPLGVVANVVNRRRAGKEAKTAEGSIAEQLAKQKADKATYAKLISGGPAVPAPTPMAADPMAGPTHAPVPPPAPAPAPAAPTAFFNPSTPKPAAPPGAVPPPPAPYANAMGMDPAALARAGVPADVQELLRQLRGR